MSAMLKIIGTGLLASSAQAADAPSLKNPGHWKSLAYSLVKGEDEGEVKALRIKNNDLFDKLCRVQIARKRAGLLDPDDPAQEPLPDPHAKLKPFYNQTILIKASRAIEIALSRKNHDLTMEEIAINAGCVHLPEGKRPDDFHLSGTTCDIQDENCGQVCPATPDDPDKCQNDHLVVIFDRSSWKAEYNEKGATLLGDFTNTSKSDLYCQVVTIVKGVNSNSGDIVYVTAPAQPKMIKASEKLTIAWGLDKSELVNSNHIDASRPRVVAACSEDDIDKSFWSKCDPLKRPECDWVVPQ